MEVKEVKTKTSVSLLPLSVQFLVVVWKNNETCSITKELSCYCQLSMFLIWESNIKSVLVTYVLCAICLYYHKLFPLEISKCATKKHWVFSCKRKESYPKEIMSPLNPGVQPRLFKIFVYTSCGGHYTIVVQLLQMFKHNANIILKQEASRSPISKHLINIYQY